jgi:hypothetical protein
LYQNATPKNDAAKTTETTFGCAANNLCIDFEGIKPFTTRIVNVIAISGINTRTIEHAKGINKKMQGAPSKKDRDGADLQPQSTSAS